MNHILEWLSGGDIRSDGMANEAAAFVLANPEIYPELYAGLSVSDDVVRSRAADALEKVARVKPALLIDDLPELIHLARTEPVPAVKMHLAMLFGHLAVYEEEKERLISVLIHLLKDTSVFAKSWAITSLCILGRKYPQGSQRILDEITPLYNDNSIAVRSKVKKAVLLLTDQDAPFVHGWIKSEHLQDLYD
jgi:HEAT repeat protein